MYSMTGFGSTSSTLTLENNQTCGITISLKSFNNRYFEATNRFSAPLLPLETDIIKNLKKKLARGHVYCTIYLDNPAAFQQDIKPSLTTAQAYVGALRTIQEHLKIESSVTLDHIVRLPNIFIIQESNISDNTKQKVFDLLSQAIEKMLISRKTEGEQLQNDITARISKMQTLISKIEKQYAKRIEEQKEKVHKTLEELKGDESSLADAQKNALYTMLDKLDLQEEITRFASHLKQINTIVASGKMEKGKRLDFTLQEMNREINTIAAKCSDSEISKNAINVKVEIEKVREQVQNIV